MVTRIDWLKLMAAMAAGCVAFSTQAMAGQFGRGGAAGQSRDSSSRPQAGDRSASRDGQLNSRGDSARSRDDDGTTDGTETSQSDARDRASGSERSERGGFFNRRGDERAVEKREEKSKTGERENAEAQSKKSEVAKKFDSSLLFADVDAKAAASGKQRSGPTNNPGLDHMSQQGLASSESGRTTAQNAIDKNAGHDGVNRGDNEPSRGELNHEKQTLEAEQQRLEGAKQRLEAEKQSWENEKAKFLSEGANMTEQQRQQAREKLEDQRQKIDAQKQQLDHQRDRFETQRQRFDDRKQRVDDSGVLLANVDAKAAGSQKQQSGPTNNPGLDHMSQQGLQSSEFGRTTAQNARDQQGAQNHLHPKREREQLNEQEREQVREFLRHHLTEQQRDRLKGMLENGLTSTEQDELRDFFKERVPAKQWDLLKGFLDHKIAESN